MVAGALLLRLGSAAPPRAPARGGIKLSSCPKGGSTAAAHADSEAAGIKTFARDYEITTPTKTAARAARGRRTRLDGAFPRRALASTDAATKSWLQLYKNFGAVYADAFDSETIKGAATAELVANKYQAGGGHALPPSSRPSAATCNTRTTGRTAPYSDVGGPDQGRRRRLGRRVRRAGAYARHHDGRRDQGRRRRRSIGPELPWADFLVPLPGTRFGGSAAQ